jgi:DNA-binding beta-propeller fold protein YncE
MTVSARFRCVTWFAGLLTALAMGCSENPRLPSSADNLSPRDAAANLQVDAGPSEPPFAYVINTKDPSLTVIDRKTQDIVRTIDFSDSVGVESGHFGSLTVDGKRLWLCSDLQNTTPAGGTMRVYDTADFSVIKQFATGCGVQSSLTHDGRFLFGSSTKTNAINVYDVPGESLLGSFDVGSAPHVGDFSPDGATYFTSNANGGHVLGFDTTVLPETLPLPLIYDQLVGTIMVHAIRVHPNGKYLFAGAGTSTHIIDLATQVTILELGGAPHNIALSPDAQTLAIGDYTNQNLTLYDISTLNSAVPDPATITATFTLPTPNYGVGHESWDPDTGKLWVTLIRTTPNDGRGLLLFIDTAATPPVIEKTVQVGSAPHGILFPGRKCE